MKMSEMALIGLGALILLPKLTKAQTTDTTYGVRTPLASVEQPLIRTPAEQLAPTATTTGESVLPEVMQELIRLVPVSEPLPIEPVAPPTNIELTAGATPVTQVSSRVQEYAAMYGATPGSPPRQPVNGGCTFQSIAPGISLARCTTGVYVMAR